MTSMLTHCVARCGMRRVAPCVTRRFLRISSEHTYADESENRAENPQETVSGTIVGIDLGTTNSCVAAMEGGQVRVIENEEGQRTTPSIVAMLPDNKILVGDSAKRQRIVNWENTFAEVKRFIGRKFNEADVQRDRKKMRYKTVSRRNNDIWIQNSFGETYSPAQVSSFVLKYLRRCAEAALEKSVKHAVITVPAYFNDAQRLATKQAGLLAGMDVFRVLNEPTAAALAYGIGTAERPVGDDADGRAQKNGVYAVYDFGGGTFDISIMDIHDGVFEVKSTAGNANLGGMDIDDELVQVISRRAKAELEGITLSNQDNQRLYEESQKARILLDSSEEVDIHLPFWGALPDGTKPSWSYSLTKREVETTANKYLRRTADSCYQALWDAGLHVPTREETADLPRVDGLLLVGGMTRMPKVRHMAERIFDIDAQPTDHVNPDEAVAVGAAIQAAVLAGALSDVILLDVIPLSLGVETMGGIFTRVIGRNTSIPSSKTKLFSTAVDNQRAVDVKVFQGERELVRDNTFLGTFQLGGIERQPRGKPKIEVLFDVDVNGIVNVRARDARSGKDHSITVAGTTSFSDEEIERILQEAEAFAEADRERKDLIVTCNDADSRVADIDRRLRDWIAQGAIKRPQVAGVFKLAYEIRELSIKSLTALDPIAFDPHELSAKIVQLEALMQKVEDAIRQGDVSSSVVLVSAGNDNDDGVQGPWMERHND